MKKLVAGFLLASSAFSAAALAQGGEDVAAVQQRLVELGYKPGNTDGTWEPRTRNAVAFFQRRNGVSNANGYVTDETLVLLGLKQPAPQAEPEPTAPPVPSYIAEPEPEYTPEPQAPIEAAAPEPAFEPAPAAAPQEEAVAEAPTEEPSSNRRKLITPVARIGFVVGGDSAFTAIADANASVDDPDIDFGGLVDAALGLNVNIGQSPVSIQLTGGYRIQEEDRDDGKARVSAVPVNLTAFYNFNKVRIGLGAVAHLDPTQYFEVQTQGTLIDRTLDDAIGGAFEVAYSPIEESSFMIGLRYEGIEYEIDGQSEKVDASSTGLFVGFGF